jgi:hypothetical protein
VTADRGAAHLTLVALLFGGTLMMGLAVDVARLGATWREATHLAATAAEAGAGWIDRSAARDGEIRLNRGEAEGAARTVLDEANQGGEIDATRRRVCVVVRMEVHPTLLTIVGAGPQTVTGRACAEPRRG